MAQIIGIDLGNYNVKTSEMEVFKSTYSPFSYKNTLTSHDIITIDGALYSIGDGKFDTESDKSMKKDVLPLFLTALARSCKRDYEVFKVVVGATSDQHKNAKLKEEIKNKLKGTFRFKIRHSDGRCADKNFVVSDVVVFPEGVGAFYSIERDLSLFDVVVIDIGGGTVNIASFENGEYKSSKSIPIGTLKALSDIRNQLSIDYPSIKFTLADTEKYFKRGYYKFDGNMDYMEYRHNIMKSYCEDIIGELNLNFTEYRSAELYVTGGGFDMFSDYLIPMLPPCHILENNIFSNAIGFKRVGESLWL